MLLQAADGLHVHLDGARVRIGVGAGSPDWFGPGHAHTSRPGLTVAAPPDGTGPVELDDDLGPARQQRVSDGAVRLSVRAYDHLPLVVFRIEATEDLSGIASGTFEQPAVGWPVLTPADRLAGGVPDGSRALVLTASEFALPSTAGAGLDGWFTLPHRPPTGWPLLMQSPDGTTLLVAPLDHFHEQIIGLNAGTLRCGWHGDLDMAPAGFATELAVYAGPGPRACIEWWGALLRRRAGTVRPGRWPDALGTRPSYWTDNGAAYWYRTEPGFDPAGSIVAAVDELRTAGVPLGSVQLDSWWYPHETLRPFDTDEWLVPPTAMVAWEERPDALPDGIPALRRRLGDPPLVAHIRHLSSSSPMAAEVPVHVDGSYAAPMTPEPYERWLDQCVAWGVETFEHDWMVEVFYGVRGLRARPGLARAWQEGIDRAAQERGITLQWCMASPADFAQTTTLRQVTSVRTSGDHGYIATPGQLWTWFCITNTLARALELAPFKDVFRTDPEVAGGHGEIEALLSAMSTGPVGLGDRAGRCDTSIVARTCRADGVLVKPHVPIAACDVSMFTNPGFRHVPLVADCWSEQPAGRWTYLLVAHANPHPEPINAEIDLSPLAATGDAGHVVVFDWRSDELMVGPSDSSWPVSLNHENWRLYVVAPVLACGVSVIGDTSKFVTAGDARLEVWDEGPSVRLTVKGAGEQVTITGWSAHPLTVEPTATGDGTALVLDRDAATGRWHLTVDVPARGWTSVRLCQPNALR